MCSDDQLPFAIYQSCSDLIDVSCISYCYYDSNGNIIFL